MGDTFCEESPLRITCGAKCLGTCLASWKLQTSAHFGRYILFICVFFLGGARMDDNGAVDRAAGLQAFKPRF